MGQDFSEMSTDEAAGRIRKCSLLDCTMGSKALPKNTIVFTLGGADGSVEQVALGPKEGLRLLERLAFHLRPDKTPPVPPYGTLKWLNRRSVLRAESNIETDRDRVRDSIRRNMPDVKEYIDETIAVLKKLLNRTGRTAPKPEKVLARIEEGFLVIADAVRGDT
jgi:hypothetical protein